MTTCGVPLWRMYYGLREKSALVRSANGAAASALLRKRLNELDLGRYSLVLLTHSVYVHLAAAIAARGPEVVAYVTDLFGGPREWFDEPGIRRYVVPSSLMAQEAARRRPSASVLVRRMATLGAGLGQQVQTPPHRIRTVLVVGGSTGAGPLRHVARFFAQHESDIACTVVTGGNGRLSRDIRSIAPGIRVHGRLPNLAATLSEHSLVITKPGSMSLMEIADSGVPYMLMKGIPGIEDGNGRAYAKSVGVDRLDVVDHLRRAIGPGGMLTPFGQRHLSRGQQFLRRLPTEALSLPDLAAAISGTR